MHSHIRAMRSWRKMPVIIAATAGTALAGAAIMSGAVAASAQTTTPEPVSPAPPDLGLSPGIAITSDPTCDLMPVVNGTITLENDCSTTQTLTIPGGVTLNGGGHTITALDPASGGFAGPVITNAGTTMNIEDLTVVGDAHDETSASLQYVGIRFFNASGSLNDVTVEDINAPSLNPNSGYGVRIDGDGTVPVDVTITGSEFSGYRRNGSVFSGPTTTVDASDNTFGPGDTSLIGVPGAPAQNGAQYSNFAGGTFSDNTVIGSTFGNATLANDSTFLLFSARNVTATDNKLLGDGQDLGASITTSTGILLEDNIFDRTPAPVPGGSAIGAGSFDAQSTEGTTLICNTFEGWNLNLAGLSPAPGVPPGPPLTQAPCITSTSVPSPATAGVPYTNPDGSQVMLQGFTQNPNAVLQWSVTDGSLPPGLTLDPSDGSIEGTPTTTGTFDFSVTLCDVSPEPNDGCSPESAEIPITVNAPTPPPTPEGPTVPSGPVQTGGGLASGSSPWLPYGGGAAAAIGLLLAVGGLVRRRQRSGA